ncbi:hypothetical protein O9992_18630 [Vibrio lentus]|nr:hypothetical protein [Vibrio lentus]
MTGWSYFRDIGNAAATGRDSNIFIMFPSMGKTTAVVCAGFGGISLGSTPATAAADLWR